MNVNRISANITTPQFTGSKNPLKNKQPETSQETVPVYVKVSPDKLNKALKAAVLIPAASIPLIMGSCSKEEDHCDYWSGGGGSSITQNDPSIHILPEFKVDSLTFANDTVRIPENLSSNSKINKTINKMLNAINIPRYSEGSFPAALTFKTDKYIQFMKLDGMASAESDNTAYYYDVQRYRNDGKVDMFKLEFTADGDDLVMTDIGLGPNTHEYRFTTDGNSVKSYQNVKDLLVPVAEYEQGDTPNYSIKQTQSDGKTVKFDNINVLFVKNDYE